MKTKVAMMTPSVEEQVMEVLKLKARYEAKEKKLKEKLLNKMTFADVTSLLGTGCTATVSRSTNYYPRNEDMSKVPKNLTKIAIDTKKVNAFREVYGRLPASVIKKQTEYVTLKEKK